MLGSFYHIAWHAEWNSESLVAQIPLSLVIDFIVISLEDGGAALRDICYC